jgi:hypothetical protein
MPTKPPALRPNSAATIAEGALAAIEIARIRLAASPLGLMILVDGLRRVMPRILEAKRNAEKETCP